MNDITEDLGASIMSVRYKVVFVGDVSVGKTSIMNRFISDEFKADYDPTIGVDFATKNIEYNESTLKLQIWDSAGQERYKALIPSYVRGASIIFIIYDASNKDTFNNLSSWIKFIKEFNTEKSIVALCGNKIDLEKQVQTIAGQELAKKEELLFFEVSAKTGENINNMMYSCIAELPFFASIGEENKAQLIEELESANSKNQQNSIYDIVNSQKFGEGSKEGINIKGTKNETIEKNQENINKDKKNCAC